MIEFALILPILILMLMGILDLGRAIYAYSTVSNAAREGARLAIVNQTQGTNCSVRTVECKAASHAVNLGVQPSSVAVSFRNPDDPNDASNVCTAREINCIAVVTVNYNFAAATPIIGNLIGNITLSSTTMLPIERTFP